MISTLDDDDDDDDDLGQDLLREIASLWVATRGYSKARKYKREKATATKGKRSLRKELKRQDTDYSSSD